MAAPNNVLKMVLSTTNVLLLSQSELTISSTDLQKRQEPSVWKGNKVGGSTCLVRSTILVPYYNLPL
jgi:hypothetical protein